MFILSLLIGEIKNSYLHRWVTFIYTILLLNKMKPINLKKFITTSNFVWEGRCVWVFFVCVLKWMVWNRRDYSCLYRSVGWHHNLFPFCLTLNFSVSPTHRTTFFFFSFLPLSFLNYCFRPLHSLYYYLNPLLIYLGTHLLLINMPPHILSFSFEKNSLGRDWLLSQPSLR